MVTNIELVTRTLNYLREGLRPFVVQEMTAIFGEDWIKGTSKKQHNPKEYIERLSDENCDVKVLLEVMIYNWDDVFKITLGFAEKNLVFELRTIRNAWAHQEPFSTDDVYRAMDSTERLLKSISAPSAKLVNAEKNTLMRKAYDQKMMDQRKKIDYNVSSDSVDSSLKPWREIITPHNDVASGNYLRAEFAADLAEVYRGDGADEYKDPKEFFSRTYMTDGIKQLITNALNRICKDNGDPVIELQTNFGGGKTHSMLALYHLFSGIKVTELPGMEEIAEQEEISDIKDVKRAVLVGTALSPAIPQTKEDGTVVNTLWGELAWQLLGKEGYDIIRGADEAGVSPGSDNLKKLFDKADGCLILIDEWVAYVRQLYGKDSLSGGTFDSNLTFAQALTEAVKATPKTLLLASIPESKIEIGGEGGEIACDQLKNTIGRIEFPWRPASADESYEIVRRRLFEPMSDSALFNLRDVTIDAFMKLYANNKEEFPQGSHEAEYRRKLKACYTIHPELFEKLYHEWSSLEKFQRTRGILRLMASVIHSLWKNEDKSLLIMPCHIPIADSTVQNELVRYLPDQWVPVIDRDIDGSNSLPLRLDKENPNLGRYSACRKVARTTYMASAPTSKAANRGTDYRHIMIGCVQPGERSAIFGDALRRLTDQAVHLYFDRQRYWFSTQPSVLSLARDRATELSDDRVDEEIITFLNKEKNKTGDFSIVHPCPTSSSDILDENATRLVILGPEHPHVMNENQTPALVYAKEILENRGSSPRIYRNSLVFLSARKDYLEPLKNAIRDYLAWDSIVDDKGEDKLNLEPTQAKQAENKMNQAKETITQRIPEAWQCIITPFKQTPSSDIEWNVYKPKGIGSLAEVTINRLSDEQILIKKMGAEMLKLELDRVPIWRGDNVEISQIIEDFGRYLYLPKVVNEDVILDAIEEGLPLLTWSQETFAYADKWDKNEKKYIGLKGGMAVSVSSTTGMIIKGDIAEPLIQTPPPIQPEEPGGEGGGSELDTGDLGTPIEGEVTTTTDDNPTRFFGCCNIDSTRANRDVGKIVDEVIQHLTALKGSDVRVSLEIEANVAEGIPENVVRIVKENCNTLKFEIHNFEDE